MIFKKSAHKKVNTFGMLAINGFDDTDFYRAQAAGISNTQLYKQAGNSIVVDVLEKIFGNLFLK